MCQLRPGLNKSTSLLRQWGFWQWLPFSWTTLRGKHCRHPIAVMGVVDTFGPGFCFFLILPEKNLWLHPWEYHLGGVMMMLQEHPANFRQLIQKKNTRKKLGLEKQKNVRLLNFLQ